MADIGLAVVESHRVQQYLLVAWDGRTLWAMVEDPNSTILLCMGGMMTAVSVLL